jgi:hypothetical protein
LSTYLRNKLSTEKEYILFLLLARIE